MMRDLRLRRLVFLASLMILAMDQLAPAESPSALHSLDSTTTHDLHVADENTVEDLYTTVAGAFDLEVVFDPKLQNVHVQVGDLDDVTATTAFQRLTRATGHFYKVLDEGSILIAEDTPENRREYEDLIIKTWFLENASVQVVDKTMRSLIEARRLSTDESLNTVTLRDTASKIDIADRLIQLLDRPRAQIEVALEVYACSSGDLRRALDKIESGRNPGSRLHLDTKQLDTVIPACGGHALTSTRLSFLGDEGAVLRGVSLPSAKLDLSIEGRVHPGQHELSLSHRIAITTVDESSDGSLSLSTCESSASLRTKSGQAALLTGLAQVANDDSGPRELVVALVPELIRSPGYTPCDLAGLLVGTESLIDATRLTVLSERCRQAR